MFATRLLVHFKRLFPNGMVNSHKTLQAKPVKTARAICIKKSNGFHPDITKHIKYEFI